MNSKMTEKLLESEMKSELESDVTEKIKIPIHENLVQEELKKPDQPKDNVDPLDGITKDEERECIDRAFNQLKKTHDRELSLAKSETRVRDQEYAVVSIVGPACNQKTDKNGIKLWGCFPDLASSRKYAQYINTIEENKDFDVYVMEMYCWCLIPPDPNSIEDTEYNDEKLDYLIKQHKVQQYKTKEVFDLRKHKLMENKDVNKYQKESCKISELPEISENEEMEENEEMKEMDYNPSVMNQLESNKNSVVDIGEGADTGKKIENESAFKKIFHQEKLPELTIESNEPNEPKEEESKEEESKEYREEFVED